MKDVNIQHIFPDSIAMSDHNNVVKKIVDESFALSHHVVIVSYDPEQSKMSLAKLHHDFLAAIRTFEYLGLKNLENLAITDPLLEEKKKSIQKHVTSLKNIKENLIDQLFPLSQKF